MNSHSPLPTKAGSSEKPKKKPGWRSIKVCQQAEFRYLVQSRSGRYPHTVDLEEFDCNGECSCEHFQYRLGPRLQTGERGRHLMCPHILAAREYRIDRELKIKSRLIGHKMKGK